MTNRRNARRRILRAPKDLAGVLNAMVKPMVRYLNSGNILERVFRKHRARRARQNYHQTGSATRWGTDPHTMWIHEPIEGKPAILPVTWSLNAPAEPFRWN